MRVLVVEDEVKMAALIRRGLRSEGMAADVATKGEDALWMAGATEYDAIVLDVMLPGIDGFELCRRLRADGVWSPVLILTARDSVGDRVAGLDGGADDYLTKPFSFAEFLARLQDARPLDRPAAPERAQPRHELGERERLDEVVVGAAVEAGDAVLDRVARGEHEHGRPDAVVAQPAADLEAVDAGQHHVEHDRVVGGGARHPQRVLALDGDVGEHPLVAQAAADQGGQLDLVLDDQHAHRRQPPTSSMSGR